MSLWAKGATIFIFAILVGGCGIVFVLSLIQTEENTKTTSAYLYVKESTLNPCQKGTLYYEYMPFAFTVGSDTKSLTCPWQPPNTWLRACMAIFGIFVGVMTIISLFKGWKLGAYFLGVCGLGLSFAFLYAMISDSNAVSVSRAWCLDGLAGIEWKNVKKPEITCVYAQFITMCIIDAGAFVFWGLSVFILFKHLRDPQAQAGEIIAASPTSDAAPMLNKVDDHVDTQIHSPKTRPAPDII